MIGNVTVREVKENPCDRKHFIITKYYKEDEITMIYNRRRQSFQFLVVGDVDCLFDTLNEALTERNRHCKPFETADYSVVVKKFDVTIGEYVNAIR